MQEEAAVADEALAFLEAIGDLRAAALTIGDDGARQTMLGFPTREAAETWIVDDKRRSHEEDYRTTSTSRSAFGA